jgi:hypothetical protein
MGDVHPHRRSHPHIYFVACSSPKKEKSKTIISWESVYSVYIVDNQPTKCLHKSLHFLKSVYTAADQRLKCLQLI